MKHALVVGGTGMLSNVLLWLVSQGCHVSVIGRNKQRMDRLISASKDKSLITPLLLDYRDDDELIKYINASVNKNGEIDLVVAWIHSIAKKALPTIAKEIAAKSNYFRVFHVLGSSSDLNDVIKKVNLFLPDGCLYRQVLLGFIIEKGYSRWLTNDEISNGVIEAIINDDVRKIVGTIEPWEKRP